MSKYKDCYICGYGVTVCKSCVDSYVGSYNGSLQAKSSVEWKEELRTTFYPTVDFVMKDTPSGTRKSPIVICCNRCNGTTIDNPWVDEPAKTLKFDCVDCTYTGISQQHQLTPDKYYEINGALYYFTINGFLRRIK